ncbi:conserved Plasmodium protein, unknown function [Plasmodium malariae]|uniref:Uncharacterized protein n=1 Tax=Plasmodium malariae TaxID=5858 RepID=A0A1C3KLA0_PLAMA|nr:conserved Plasmodium protein, unknown function [Plasmodium malariae]
MMKGKKIKSMKSKYIRNQVKQTELECQILNKYLKKVEEERKIFDLSTVVLKKYNSYLNNNLINNIDFHYFRNVFLNTCGILFTNSYTTFERDSDNDMSKGTYLRASVKRSISDYTRNKYNNKKNRNSNSNILSWVKLKKEKYKQLEKKKSIMSFVNPSKQGTTKINRSCYSYNTLKNYKKLIESQKSEDKLKWKISKLSFNGKEACNEANDEAEVEEDVEDENEYDSPSDSETDINIKLLKEKMNINNYEQARKKEEKKKKKKKNFSITTLNGYLDSKARDIKSPWINSHDFKKYVEEAESGNITKSGCTNKNNKNCKRIYDMGLSNYRTFTSKHDRSYLVHTENTFHGQEKKKKGKKGKNTYEEQMYTLDEKSFSYNSLSSSSSYYRNKNNMDRKKMNNTSYIDSYIDMIKKDKIFSYFENKTETKSSTFSDLMNNIKKLFFFGEKKDNENEDLESEKQNKQKGDFKILKYQCLVKSKRGKIYLCVCPNCAKKFYLLIKKGSNKKTISKVFPPSHFSSVVEYLKRQETQCLNEQKYEKCADSKSSQLEISSLKYFYESASFIENENSVNFCKCYARMNDSNNNNNNSDNFFGNLDMLLYL